MTTKKLNIRQLALGAAASALAVGGATAMSSTAANAQAPRLLAPNAVTLNAETIPNLVERVSPAVVSVLVEREVERQAAADPFREFFQFRFGDPNQRGPQEEDDMGGVERMQAQGSGFFIDAAGHIVTNNHVIEEADKIKVRLADGKELDAELVGRDELTDLAVIKVTPVKGQAFVRFADDVKLRVGETVVAVGNPFGLGGTVTSGIVSAIGGQNRQGQFLDFVQIDAPINRGNSGGPTFDLQGRVVGVNTAIYSPNGGSVGIGFAIPARVATETVKQLIANGQVTRGWLGVELGQLDTTLAAALGRKDTTGALVNNVLDGTPARKAGLEAGDLILKINNEIVADTTDLSRKVASYPPGEKIKVAFLRDGAEKTLTVTLGERDAESAAANDNAPSDVGDDTLGVDYGLRVSELSDAMKAQFRINDDVNGVVVTGVRGGGPASEAGLRPGMVILQVEGQAVKTANDLKSRLAAATKSGKEAALLRIQLGEQKQFAAMPLKGDS
jgi:serine protease Do